MITDRNEAFKHNSCKKVAQLSKVIVSMRNISMDYAAMLLSVANRYENTITQIFIDHRQQLEDINTRLFNFRKATIDNECRKFAQKYKAAKTEYNELVTSRVETVNNISKEAKDLTEIIAQLRKQNFQSADPVINSADKFKAEFMSTKKKQKPKSKAEVNSAVNPLKEKMKQLQVEHDEKMTKMANEHKSLVKSLMREKNVQLFNEIIKRRPVLVSLLTKIKRAKDANNQLFSDLSNYRNTESQLIRQYRQNFSDFLQQYTSSIAKNNAQIQAIRGKAAALVNTFQEELVNEGKVRAQKQSHMKNEIASLISQINQIKYNNEHLVETKMGDISNQQMQIAASQAEYKQVLEKERQYFESLIQESHSNIDSLGTSIQVVKDNFSESLKSMFASIYQSKTYLQNQIGSELQNFEKRLKELTVKFDKYETDQFSNITGVINTSNEIGKNKTRSIQTEIEKSQGDIRRLNQANQTEINQIEQKNKTKISDYEKANNCRLDGRKSEIKQAETRKETENKKKAEQVLSGFRKDLQDKKTKSKETFDKQSSDNLANLAKSTEKSGALIEHEKEVEELQRKLQVAEELINKANIESQNKSSALNAMISNTEKLIRQHQRSIKSETEEIGKEYDIKIQFEQVELQNKIEQLSKLFDAEENKRAFMVIDQIRKIRNVQNRTQDMINQRKRSLEQMKNQNEQKVKKMQQQLESAKNGDKLTKLQEDFKQKQTEMEKKIADANKQLEDDKTKISNNLTKTKKEFEDEKVKIEKKYQDDEASFKREIEVNKKNNDDLQADIQKKKQEIIQKIEQQKQNLLEEHKKSLSAIQRRIESVKSSLTELQNLCNDEYDKKKNVLDDNLSKRLVKDDQYIQQMLNTSNERSQQLDNDIKRLWEYRGSLVAQFQDPEMANDEKQRIAAKKKECEAALQKVNEAQSQFIDVITGLEMHSQSLNSMLISPRTSMRSRGKARIMSPHI